MSVPEEPGIAGDRVQIGTTRGGQPIESVSSPEEIVQVERASGEAIAEGRETIGTTRGGQPIESLTPTEGEIGRMSAD